MDEVITTLAAAQHGAVARRQLLARGLHPDAVDASVARGRLRRTAHGVYVVPGSPGTIQQQLVVATLRCGPGARVAGEPVLSMLGVREARLDGPWHVLVRPGRWVSNVPWHVRADPVPDGPGRSDVFGVPAFSVARCLIETVGRCGPDDVERLVDGVRWLGRRAVRGVADLLGHEAFAVHGGARRLRESGLVAGAAPESGPERRLLSLLAAHRPESQAWLADDLRVDVLLRAAGLVLEYDGEAPHGGPRARVSDEERDQRIRALGYAVLHVGASDLAAPDVLLPRVEALVATLVDHS